MSFGTYNDADVLVFHFDTSRDQIIVLFQAVRIASSGCSSIHRGSL
jgi:hypothetical protein